MERNLSSRLGSMHVRSKRPKNNNNKVRIRIYLRLRHKQLFFIIRQLAKEVMSLAAHNNRTFNFVNDFWHNSNCDCREHEQCVSE